MNWVKENIIKGLFCTLQRMIYTILLFVWVISLFCIYIPIAMIILIPLCGLVWIISGKDYYETILGFTDKFYYIDEYLIKLLRIR